MRFLLMANSNRGRIIAVCEILSRTEVKNRHIRPQYSDCRPSAEERPAISTKYTSLKVQWATAMLLIQHGPIFIRLAVVDSQIYESAKIRTHSSSRSSKVIDLGANAISF